LQEQIHCTKVENEKALEAKNRKLKELKEECEGLKEICANVKNFYNKENELNKVISKMKHNEAIQRLNEKMNSSREDIKKYKRRINSRNQRSKISLKH